MQKTKTDKYEESSSTYKQYLEEEIEKEVNKIKNIHFLEDIYGSLIKTQFNAPAVFPKDDQSYGKSQIFANLLNQYQYGNNETKTMIEKKLSKKPKIVDALKKRNIICEGLSIIEKKSNQNKENDFIQHLTQNKQILTKRRDSGFNTFIKGLGVVAATIFGIGVGGIMAYKHLFGSKATEGKKYISDINIIKETKLKK